MSSMVVRYKCSYCNKELKTEKGITHHEKARCYHNPNNHTCFTCGLFVDNERKDLVVQSTNWFSFSPECADRHDCFWDKFSGEWEVEEPIRQSECEFYKPRSEHPGEYVKFSSGSGGYRKVYLEEKE